MAIIKQEQENQGKLDSFKWLLATVLLIAGLYANYRFSEQPTPIIMVGWIVLVAIILGVASLTSKGQTALTFIKEARTELRKVVWPSKQETIQTTLVVALLVLIISLVLWVIDMGVMLLIQRITG